MGTDMHLHIELKIDGRWEHWSAPRIDRNYEFFAKPDADVLETVDREREPCEDLVGGEC